MCHEVKINWIIFQCTQNYKESTSELHRLVPIHDQLSHDNSVERKSWDC